MTKLTAVEVDQILDDWDAQYQPDPFSDLEENDEPLGANFNWHSMVGAFQVPDPMYTWDPDYEWTSGDSSLAEVLGGVIEDGRLHFPSPVPGETMDSGDSLETGESLESVDSLKLGDIQSNRDSAQESSMRPDPGLVEELGGMVVDGMALFPSEILE